MSYPILYKSTETNFDHNGYGILGDCVSCIVTEEANGEFELAMQYPMDGIHFEDISTRSIIKAKADQFRDPQLFRVYAIGKPMSGIVSVLAEHISYDLSGIPVSLFNAENVSNALAGLKSNAVVSCPFEFWTDKTTQANFKVSVPVSIRSRLGGTVGSILDVYGGEYEFDNYTVKLHNNRGMNRGVSIRYGKNLTDIQQEENCSSVITGVYPYWMDAEGNTLVELPEKIVNAPGTYNFDRIKTLDLSEQYENKPTIEQIRAFAKKYVESNNVGVPKISLSVSFAQLEQSEEYKGLKLLERVSLFDTVNVEFPALKVSATAKAVKVVYDCLANRVKSVTLGNVRANIADTIAEQIVEIEKKSNKSFLQVVIESLTKTILGAKGGSVRFLDTNSDGEPDTLYIADNPDPTQAIKVWRFNYEGWGASKNGYNGPFELGATFEDGILADFITAGTLYGILVKAGAIEDVNGKIRIDLSNGNRVKLNSGITSNDLAIRPAGMDKDLFRVLVDTDGSTTDSFLSLNGYFDNGKTMFTVGSEYIDTNADQETNGSSIRLFSKKGRVSIGSNQNGESLSFLDTNGAKNFGIRLDKNGNASISLPQDSGAFKKLSWKSNGDGTYTLIGR